MASNNLPVIEKLKGRENYNTWRFAMKSFLELDDLWSCVNGTDSTTDLEKKTRRDVKAKSKIILSVDPINYVHIQNADTAKDVWDKLTTTFHDSGLARKVSLIRILISTNLENCESVENYVGKIMSTAQKLNDIQFEISDEWLGTFLLAGLPDEYKPMIMAIESSGIKLTADSVKTKLLQEVKSTKTTNSVALYNKSQHSKKSFNNNNKGPRCFNCNGYGHISKKCTKKRAQSQHSNGYDNKSSLLSTCSTFMASNRNIWYVDSGASAHMSHLPLDNLRKSPVNEITVANNQKISVHGIGTCVINVNNTDVTINDVLYVPDLSANLISVGQTIKHGNSVVFDAKGCKIVNEMGSVIATASLTDNIYQLNCTSDNGISFAAKTNKMDLWHRRLGHLNYTYMKNLRCIKDLHISKNLNDKCVVCVKGKQCIQPFKNVGNRATRFLELIHSDVCGPMETVSLGGARYFVTFIDDFSHKVFVYMLKSKGEVETKFKIFKAFVEQQTGHNIKILRSDNGGEYLSNCFSQFLEQVGIQHQRTVPYTPQQNGLAERMNRTIVEKVRCMLIDSGLGKEFWAEAVATAVYLVNRSPTKFLSHKTPEEIWSKKDLNLEHLKIFGCKAIMHVPKQHRKKLDAKSRECVFVGYSLDTKGYRLYDPISGTTHIARDVVFLEQDIVKPCVIEPENFINLDLVGDNPEELPQFEDNALEVGEAENVSFQSDNSSTLPDNNSTDSGFEAPPVRTEVTENVRRSERQRKPVHMPDFQLYAVKSSRFDPVTVVDALNRPDSESWKLAMKAEYNSLLSNQTWDLVEKPKGVNIIKSKWVFKTKTSTDGDVQYKARLVAKGCAQKPGIDYEETYSPVVRYASVRYLLALSVRYDLHIDQMDAVSAFLQGDLSEDIYMTQPESFEESDQVCRLRKTIYGLKQASRAWNKKLHSSLLQVGLKDSKTDPCVYFRVSDKNMTFVAVYVDDLLIFSNDQTFKNKLKRDLSSEFKMKDMGEAKHCLGFEIKRDFKNGTLRINQSKYINEILCRFNMSECNPVSTPLDTNQKLTAEMSPKNPVEQREMRDIPYQQAVGSLLYAAHGTRPDIAFAVSLVSRFNNNPGKPHWNAVKRIFRYLKGTNSFELEFSKDANKGVFGYCDADWAGDIDSRRSMTGYIFKFQGGPITWGTKKQATVALSTAEAEYMALSMATQDAMWLRSLNKEFKMEKLTPTTIFCDNKSAIDLAHTTIHHSRSKHIDIRHHYVREKIASGDIELQYIDTGNMTADILTKGLVKGNHFKCVNAMGLNSHEK